MEDGMSNIAYTSEYLAERKELEAKFLPEYMKQLENVWLSNGYRLERQYYEGTYKDFYEGSLFDKDGQNIFKYRNLDDDCDFASIIHHANGHVYFLFRTELYGYGVFDITARKEFHFIPKAPESFIWTDVTYNPQNNILIASGCYWACPWGIVLLDFSNPMCETKWVDIYDPFGGYTLYSDIDFAGWRENNDLVLKVRQAHSSEHEEITVPQEQYRQWFVAN